jgi:single-strand DNA-binding protein
MPSLNVAGNFKTINYLTGMNNLKNSVRLIGNLGQTPEVKDLSNGKKLAKFSMAINESYKNETGERVTDTQWHNITAWGKQAELVSKLLKKGSEVAIEGKLTNNTYTDKDGVKRYSTEIVLNEFTMVGGKKEQP